MRISDIVHICECFLDYETNAATDICQQATAIDMFGAGQIFDARGEKSICAFLQTRFRNRRGLRRTSQNTVGPGDSRSSCVAIGDPHFQNRRGQSLSFPVSFDKIICGPFAHPFSL